MKTFKLYKWRFPFHLQLRFDSQLWQENPSLRRYFVQHIIESGMAIGLTQSEVQNTFGLAQNGEYANIKGFDISQSFVSRTKQKLNFYFTEGKVERVALKYRYRRKR